MMKKIIVLFILGFLARNALAIDGIIVSSDTMGETVTVDIVAGDLSFEYSLYPQGEIISLKITAKNAGYSRNKVEYAIHFFEGKARSIYYSWYGADSDYKSETYHNDQGIYKKLFSLAEKFAKKMSNNYNLPKLAREEAIRKRAVIKRLEEEQKKQEMEKAKLRPNPAVMLEKILKGN